MAVCCWSGSGGHCLIKLAPSLLWAMGQDAWLVFDIHNNRHLRKKTLGVKILDRLFETGHRIMEQAILRGRGGLHET